MMIFWGDFCQIPPVTADPVNIPFKISDEEDGHVSQFQKDVLSLENRDYQIWRDIKHAIILEEIMRHKEDLRLKNVSRTNGLKY